MGWNDDLRAGQSAAASQPSGNFVILAGPGTGKTFVLVRRIQYLVEELGINPSSITALTFTRAAAAEMRERLDERFQAFRVRVSTLHSYALRELLGRKTGDILRPVRVVDDWEERNIVVEDLARLLGRSVTRITNKRHTGALDLLADDWDTLNAAEDDWEQGHADPHFLAAWQLHRQVYGYTLRSELVYQLLQELRANPDLGPSTDTKVFLVDEYQDLNSCDLQTIRTLVERSGGSITAAGDDDQSIYSFRHAIPAGIRTFGDAYANGYEVTMMECLRCGEAVVHLANWLISQEADRIAKELTSVTSWGADVTLLRFTDHIEEAQEVARLIAHEIALGTLAEDVLVVLRSDRGGHVSSAITQQLAAYDVSTYLPRASEDFSEDSQRLLEYLKLAGSLQAGDTDDLAIRALLQLDDNGIGKARLRAVLDHSLDWGVRFTEALERLREHPTDFASTGLASLLAALDAILVRANTVHHQVGEGIGDWVARVASELDLSEPSTEVLLAAAEAVELSLADMAGALDTAPINYVQELSAALAGLEEARPTKVPGSVTITTMHGAKGLSADITFVLQAEDEVIPNATAGAEYRETRRLLYVSLTRARKKLFVGACTKRGDGQEWVRDHRHWNRTLTRFLSGYGLVATTAEAYLQE